MRGANGRKTERARRLRKGDNDAETLLWSDLRGRRLNDFKFVRQFAIGPYFADFACRKKMLVIEIDGSQHADSEYDRKRNEFMLMNGWSIVRFWNVDVLKARETVLETIVAICDGRLAEPVLSTGFTFLPALERP
ncbi:UNVERIFIED_ORG: very-short-patch-repair endonuclease [Shinella zoogloeoides]|nr:very-short-patch-repair endonuclease [Shinella zoogloeoides]